MDTVIACLTPPGKAAIATLSVRGPQAWAITRQLFQPAKSSLPEEPTAGRFWFGKLGKDHADEVILAVKQAAPVPCLELHCHGGVEVVRMLQELFQLHGVLVVPWQTFFDGSEKLHEMLARAPTTRTAGILLDQIHGAWQEMLDAMEGAEPSAARQKLERLNALIPLGKHLVAPWRIVIAGAPNVGKSSLMNALAGYPRSIVSPIPGTTRDLVTTRLAIDGWPIDCTDTAGIRPTHRLLERQGISRAHAAVREADLRFWLLDGSTEPIFPEEGAVTLGEGGAESWIFLINKIDLPAAWDWELAPQAQRISAQTGTGVRELCDLISQRLVRHPPLPGEAVPCLPEHFAMVAPWPSV